MNPEPRWVVVYYLPVGDDLWILNGFGAESFGRPRKLRWLGYAARFGSAGEARDWAARNAPLACEDSPEVMTEAEAKFEANRI